MHPTNTLFLFFPSRKVFLCRKKGNPGNQNDTKTYFCSIPSNQPIPFDLTIECFKFCCLENIQTLNSNIENNTCEFETRRNETQGGDDCCSKNFEVNVRTLNCNLCVVNVSITTNLPANEMTTSLVSSSTTRKSTHSQTTFTVAQKESTVYYTSSKPTESSNSNNIKMTPLVTSKPTPESQKDTRNETTQLLIGIIVAVGIALIIAIIILIFCVRRKLRKAVDTNSDPVKFTHDNYDKTLIDSELPSNIYQQINETSDQSDHYHQISTLGSDTSPNELFNDKRSLLVSANHFEGDNSSHGNTAGHYFHLEKDDADKTYTTDKDNAGGYFVLEEREMLQNTNKVQDISSSDDITTSSHGYSKLGLIERQTNDQYGMLSNSNKVPANKTSAPYEMAKPIQTTQGTITRNQGDILTSTPENDSTANYFVLESDCLKSQDSETSSSTLPSNGYAKLGEVSRQTNDSYGVLSNVNGMPLQEIDAPYEKAKLVENPQDNYCLASSSSNLDNGCVSPDDTPANYFVLESNSSVIENEGNNVMVLSEQKNMDEINSYSKLGDDQDILAPHVYDVLQQREAT
ncbi:hypothetical protein BgiBS90_035821 [Biomphalaria glabrata]|nr:hypothetical protein BgiBS90_035821 [Biomphalaria glabrata]